MVGKAVGGAVGRTVRSRRAAGLMMVAIIAAFACIAIMFCSCSQEATQSSQQSPTPTPSSSAKSALVSDAVLSQNEWGDYFERVGQDAFAWAQGFAVDNVEKVTLRWFMEGGVVSHEYTDGQSITATFNALAVLSLGEKTDVVTEDNSYSVSFVMKDGGERSFTFDNENAELGRQSVSADREIYTLKNTQALSALLSRARDTDTATCDE